MPATQKPSGNARTGIPAFHALLKRWRHKRGLSQLALAVEAGVSSRHLSFLETGRARPSRAMVDRLAQCLGIPAAERNALRVAAGFAPVLEDGSRSIDIDERQEMLQRILNRHTVPALVIDDGWVVRMRNDAASHLFANFRPAYRLPKTIKNNAMHILCHPFGLRQFMPNWSRYAAPFIREIDREALLAKIPSAHALRNALYAYPGIKEAAERYDTEAKVSTEPLTLQLRHREATLAFETVFTTVAVTDALQPRQVKIECFYPADQATEKALYRLMV